MTLALLGSNAPRQRRGRNGLIGVSASSGALIGMIGALRGQIIGGGACRRCHQNAVGDQFGEPFLSIDQDAQVRRLRALPEQRHLVDGAMLVDAPLRVARLHDQGMDDGDMRGRQSLGQALLDEFIHQEADGAAMHAVDRLAGIHELVQGLQHQPVAAERDNNVGLGGVGVAVALFQPRIGLARLGRLAGDEGDMLETLGRLAHEGT